jgi:2-methylcitrate dehydratase PrpD
MFHSTGEEISSSFLQGLTVATGFLSNRGTVTKSFQVGRSAAEGIICAIASRNGVTVSKNILKTFAASLSGSSEIDLVTKDLSKKWHVLDNYLKPYPCGVVLHPGIDAAIRMREKNIAFEDVDRVDVHVNPVVLVLTGIMEPNTGLESKFSVTHAIAAALVYGPLYPEHFSDKAVSDRKILEIRRKIKVHSDENINRGQTLIEVKYKNGKTETVDLNRGPETPSKHLDENDVHLKFSHLVEPVTGKDVAVEIWNYLRDFQKKSDISEIVEIFE